MSDQTPSHRLRGQSSRRQRRGEKLRDTAGVEGMDFVAAIPQFHSVGTGVSTGYRPIAVHSGQFRSLFLAEALEIESQYSNKCITSFGSRQESQPAFFGVPQKISLALSRPFCKKRDFQQKDNLLQVSG
jgi:hypothetical protein